MKISVPVFLYLEPLLNERAVAPYDNEYAMTDLGNRIIKLLRDDNTTALFTIGDTKPYKFTGITVEKTIEISLWKLIKGIFKRNTDVKE